MYPLFGLTFTEIAMVERVRMGEEDSGTLQGEAGILACPDSAGRNVRNTFEDEEDPEERADNDPNLA